MVNRSMSDKFIKYIISDMAEMYSVDKETAKELIRKYDFESLAAEYPNETFHYSPEYWAEEIFNTKSIMMSI